MAFCCRGKSYLFPKLSRAPLVSSALRCIYPKSCGDLAMPGGFGDLLEVFSSRFELNTHHPVYTASDNLIFPFSHYLFSSFSHFPFFIYWNVFD
jgi:hypothetical protein